MSLLGKWWLMFNSPCYSLLATPEMHPLVYGPSKLWLPLKLRRIPETWDPKRCHALPTVRASTECTIGHWCTPQNPSCLMYQAGPAGWGPFKGFLPVRDPIIAREKGKPDPNVIPHALCNMHVVMWGSGPNSGPCRCAQKVLHGETSLQATRTEAS